MVEIEATGSVAISDAKEGGTVTVTDTITDGNGPVTLSYQWQKFDGSAWVDVVGETGDTYGVAGNQSEVGDEIRVVVTSTDNSGYTTVFTSNEDTIDNVNDDPVLSTQGVVLTSINENNAATLVANLVVSDDDTAEGDVVTLSLDGQDKAYFEINADGDLVLKAGVDYETLAADNKTLDVTVVATDASGATDSQDFDVVIGNVAEQTVYSRTVGTDTTPDTITISSWNAGDKIVVNVNGNPFTIVEESGFLYNNNQKQQAKDAAGNGLGVDGFEFFADNVSVTYYKQNNSQNSPVNAWVAVDGDGDGDADLYFDVQNVGLGNLSSDNFELI